MLPGGALNVGLRAAGLAFRFTLTLFIAKYLALEALGLASFLFAAVGMTPFLLGLGLRHRINREIVHRPLDEAAARLRDRVALHGLVVLALVPVAAIMLALALAGVLPLPGSGLTTWVLCAGIIVAICEPVAFELQQGLINLRRPAVANVFTFIRSAAWAPLFVACAWMASGLRSLDALLAFWLCGCALAFLYLAGALRAWPWQAIFRRGTDLKWLFRDYRTCLVVYCGDLAMLVAQYADRALIAGLLGMREVGIYFFYWSFAAGVHQLLYSGVVQVAMPALVHGARTDEAAFRAALLHGLKTVAGWAVLLCSGCGVFVAVLVQHLGQPGLAAHLYLLPILLLGMSLAACSDLLSTALYAKHLDSAVAASRFLQMGCALLFTTAGVLAFGLVGVALSAAANALAMVLLRALLVRRSLAAHGLARASSVSASQGSHA